MRPTSLTCFQGNGMCYRRIQEYIKLLKYYNLFMRKLEYLNKKSIKSYKRTKLLFETETSQLSTDLKTATKIQNKSLASASFQV